MKLINELWYGNVAPFEQCTRGDKQMKELLSLMARNRDELGEGLTRKDPSDSPRGKKRSKSSRKRSTRCPVLLSAMPSHTGYGWGSG